MCSDSSISFDNCYVAVYMLLTDGEWVFMVTWMYSDIASISVYRNLLAWTNICPFFLWFWLAACPASHIHYSIHLCHLITSSSHSCRTVLGHVHIPLRSSFFTECNLVLPLSISSILSFPEGHPVAAYAFFLIFPSILSFLAFLLFIVFNP